MKQCKNCKSMMGDSLDFCWNCGAKAPAFSTSGSVMGGIGKGMVYVLFYFLSQTVVTFAYSIFYAVIEVINSKGVIDPDKLTETVLGKSTEITVISGGLTLLILILFFALRKKNLCKEINCNVSPGLMGVGVVLLGISLNYVISLLISVLPIPESILKQQEQAYSYLGDGSLALEFIAVVICAPLVEEIVFRGLCFGSCRRVMPFWLSMIISAALFGVVHGTVIAFVYASILGALMACFYEISGSLWVPILLHVGFNGGNYLVGITPAENAWILGIIVLAAPVIAVVMSIICIRYYKKKKSQLKISQSQRALASDNTINSEEGTFETSPSSYEKKTEDETNGDT